MDEKFIAERITELRLKKDISEYQMSLDLGKNKSYIQNISSGRSLPSMSQFYEICRYFEITPQEFFDEANTVPEQMRALMDCARHLNRSQLSSLISIARELQH